MDSNEKNISISKFVKIKKYMEIKNFDLLQKFIKKNYHNNIIKNFTDKIPYIKKIKYPKIYVEEEDQRLLFVKKMYVRQGIKDIDKEIINYITPPVHFSIMKRPRKRMRKGNTNKANKRVEKIRKMQQQKLYRMNILLEPLQIQQPQIQLQKKKKPQDSNTNFKRLSKIEKMTKERENRINKEKFLSTLSKDEIKKLEIEKQGKKELEKKRKEADEIKKLEKIENDRLDNIEKERKEKIQNERINKLELELLKIEKHRNKKNISKEEEKELKRLEKIRNFEEMINIENVLDIERLQKKREDKEIYKVNREIHRRIKYEKSENKRLEKIRKKANRLKEGRKKEQINVITRHQLRNEKKNKVIRSSVSSRLEREEFVKQRIKKKKEFEERRRKGLKPT